MRPTLFAMSLLVIYSLGASAADYSGPLDCLMAVEQAPRALPYIFGVNPARNGFPAGAYVYENDRAYFCALPKDPDVIDPKGNYRSWNLNLDVNGILHPFSTALGTADPGSTHAQLTHVGNLNVTPQVKCESNDLPRMRKALEAQILDEIAMFSSSRIVTKT